MEFDGLIEAISKIIDAIVGAAMDTMDALAEMAIEEETTAVWEEPSYPVIKVVRMNNTGLMAATVTRTLIPL